jgi:predicted adenylyl cyclase CyaB
MKFNNVEIKAKYYDLGYAREILKSKNADFKGKDFQRDTYFNFIDGKLKIREGNIENNLIYYKRENEEIKKAKGLIFPLGNNKSLKEKLAEGLGILITIEKEREIYFIDNVKFHLDKILNLGNFIEIEAINYENILEEKLKEQVDCYVNLFKIQKENLIKESYSDLLLTKTMPTPAS